MLILAARTEQRRARSRNPSGLDPSVLTAHSGRAEFRSPTVDDVDALVALASQPHTVQGNGWSQQTLTEHEATLRSPGFDAFARGAIVSVLPDGEIIGVASVALKPGAASELSLGIHISQDHQGEGYGRELMQAMISATRASTQWPVWVGTATSNVAMQTIMSSLGYEPSGDPEPFETPNGEIVDSLWYRCDYAGRDA